MRINLNKANFWPCFPPSVAIYPREKRVCEYYLDLPPSWKCLPKNTCCSHFLSWVVISALPEVRNVHPKSSSEEIHWKPGTVSSSIIFFYGCLLPFVLSVEPFLHPVLTGKCPALAHQGYNQTIFPVVGKCQSFSLQMAECKPSVGVVTGVTCCTWMSMEGTHGTQV